MHHAFAKTLDQDQYLPGSDKTFTRAQDMILLIVGLRDPEFTPSANNLQTARGVRYFEEFIGAETNFMAIRSRDQISRDPIWSADRMIHFSSLQFFFLKSTPSVYYLDILTLGILSHNYMHSNS